MKTKKFVVVFVLLAVLALGGTAIAYMVHKTNVQTNTFQIAQVGCMVEEEFDCQQKTSIKVRNKIDETTPSNVDVYIRVRLVTYWEDDDGNIVGKPSEMPTFTLGSGWIADETNNTYYYTNKVAPGEFTGNLLEGGMTLGVSPEVYKQIVEVFAEAIQAEPTAAVTESWGVTLNSAGVITNVS